MPIAWNYRVVAFGSGDERILKLCEVYYDTAGNPTSLCPVSLMGATFDEIAADMARMQEALRVPKMYETDIRPHGEEP
jgi:hypothetical protein